jgi:Holliday junction resolvasome RuvABC ATP-dependent DNA helicase subunit
MGDHIDPESLDPSRQDAALEGGAEHTLAQCSRRAILAILVLQSVSGPIALKSRPIPRYRSRLFRNIRDFVFVKMFASEAALNYYANASAINFSCSFL